MKTFLLLLLFGNYFLYAQVGIGTTSPSESSMLEINSEASDGSFKGMMPPRVTIAQRDLINPTDADTGLMVFVNDPDASIYGLQVYNGTFWENIYLLQSSIQPTEVSFTITETSQSESDVAIDLEFNITNPSTTNGLTLTVAASSYADLAETTAQVITIPPNTQVFNATEVFTLVDDTEVEGNEQILFSITNASGGSGAPTIGANSIFDLTVVDNDVNLWINEIHYDNLGGDVEERVEIAGSAGIDLTGYSIYHYNGSGGTIISTENILGIIVEISSGIGVKNIDFTSLQNGPDALALVDPSGNVIQFLSYEDEVIATEGPAAGMTSILLSISEEPAVTIGLSMQLTGAGNQYTDFTWTLAPDTIDAINSGQTFN
ncbi:lamin tail domain-containing protein [Leeuwenhoekiella palythoae]|uniref:Calx-beta domain-containing protein n=1 Tax=Leeuwenhoekiella palythoae TaxID=573501 RepID=A0A1M5ZK77_9FLAO|nr:lamin tail domain-containing protein [Leeuwenhoekiella palythoae]RXG27806.1 hypothetical protein DSM01_2925 [Leeuwenhoekiella palythoae]SHI24564.1 hypothetical protein SAMN04487999_3172 [Leeuwenhoekiella palythoae]